MIYFLRSFLILLPFLAAGQVKYHYDINGHVFLEKGYSFSLYDIAGKRTIILDSTHTVISAFDNITGKLLWSKEPVKASSDGVYETGKFFVRSMKLSKFEIGFNPRLRYKMLGSINRAYASNFLTTESVIYLSYDTPYGSLNGSISLETGESYIFIQN